MDLQEYNYDEILDQFDKIDRDEMPDHHLDAWDIIQNGLLNEWRMHWIDDHLVAEGLPSTETIFTYYNIKPYKS